MNLVETEERMVYVYAVTRGGPEAETAAVALPGVLGTPVRALSEEGLTALVGEVPAEEFGQEALRRRLEDLEELEAIARSHHAVVEEVCARTTALPLRLATVYLDEERVRAMLRDRAGEFAALLDRLDGHQEWGVKVYADPRARSEAAAAQPVGSAGTGEQSPGRAYLQRRRMQRRSHEDAHRRAGEAAAAVAAEASRIAVDRVCHRPQQGELAAGPGQNIANDAYLVPVARVEEFCRRVVEAAGELPGVRVEVTGPWAPYSFASPPPTPGPGSPAPDPGPPVTAPPATEER